MATNHLVWLSNLAAVILNNINLLNLIWVSQSEPHLDEFAVEFLIIIKILFVCVCVYVCVCVVCVCVCEGWD